MIVGTTHATHNIDLTIAALIIINLIMIQAVQQIFVVKKVLAGEIFQSFAKYGWYGLYNCRTLSIMPLVKTQAVND